MGKRKTRQMNPEPFLPVGNQSVSSKKRSKPPKEHQNENKLISSGLSSKILKQALIQQKEIQEEEEGALRQQSDNPNIKSLVFVAEEPSEGEVDDMDDFAGFSETQSQFGDFESRTCSLREAVIVGSILQKISIPPLHSSVALLKLAEMEYYGTTSYFIKLIVEKKYALPYRVLDGVVGHFMRFLEDTRVMPVIWHQSLLAFVQRYKNELPKTVKENLRILLEKQKHYLITPEISRELNNSRGEKEDDLMLISSPISVINKTIEEGRFDIPEVSMEED